MKHQDFERLVTRLEKRFADDPSQLRTRILAWAFLGYAGFFAWFGLE